MDVENWMKAKTMCGNETSLAFKSGFYADMSTESMDVQDQMKVLYSKFFTNTMCENERTSDVKSEFSADMSMDVENRMNMQYNTSYSHKMCENERTNATDGTSEFSTNKMFKSHQDLLDWVKTTARSLGYAIVTQRSKKQTSGVMTKVMLRCDRGGIYKNRPSSNRTTKKINCPFQLVGKYSKMYDSWTLRVKCANHNHEPTLDMESHPHANIISDADFIAVPAEDEPTFGRLFQPHRDVVLNKPQGPLLMNDSLEGYHVQGQSAEWRGGRVEGDKTVDCDVEFEKRHGKGLYEGAQSDSDMEENGLQSDVNFDGLADIWKEMNVGFELNKSMDLEDRTNSQYNKSFTQTVRENERTDSVKGKSGFSTNMVFRSQEDLKHWVQNVGRSLGYVIVTRRSKKFKTNCCLTKVTLMCDRSGISKSTSSTTNRTTKKTNCPFQLVGKYWKMYNFWTLRVICEKHNHEPALDMEDHPYAQRLSVDEYRLVVDLIKKKVKPQGILSTLKEKNPNNVSTLKTIYHARKKLRKTGHAETIIGKTTNGEASVSPSPPYTSQAFDANKMKQTVDHTNPYAISKLVQRFDSAKQGTFTGQVPMPCYKRPSSFQNDLTLTIPVKEVSNPYLVRDMFLLDDKPEGQFFMKQFLEGDYSLRQSSLGQTYAVAESRDMKHKIDCVLEINRKHGKGEYVGVPSDSGMEENKSSDVNGFTDIWKNMTAGSESSESMVVNDRMNTRCDTKSRRAEYDDKNERQFPVSSTPEFCTDMIMTGDEASHFDMYVCESQMPIQGFGESQVPLGTLVGY